MENNEWMGPQSQILMENRMKTQKLEAFVRVNAQAEEFGKSDLKGIRGIGEKTLALLMDNGIRTIAQLKETSEEDLNRLIASPITRKQISDYFSQAG